MLMVDITLWNVDIAGLHKQVTYSGIDHMAVPSPGIARVANVHQGFIPASTSLTDAVGCRLAQAVSAFVMYV